MVGQRRLLIALLSLLAFTTQAGPLPPDTDYLDAVWIAESNGAIKLAGSNSGTICQLPEKKGADAVAVDERGGIVWIFGSDQLNSYSFGCTLLSETAVPAHDQSAKLLADQTNGSVWLGSQNHLYHFDANGKLKDSITLNHGFRGLAIDSEESRVWVATEGGLTQYDSDGYAQQELRLPIGERIGAITFDSSSGELWTATQESLVRLRADGARTLSVPFHEAEYLSADGRGGIWAASVHTVQHIDGTGRVIADVQPFNPSVSGGIQGLEADLTNSGVWVVGKKVGAQLDAEGNLLRNLEENRFGGTIRTLALYSDRIPPDLTVVAPPDNGFINTNLPQFKLAYSDIGIGVDTASLRVMRGAERLTFNCEFDEDTAICAPTMGLPEGKATLELSIADYVGNVSEKVAHTTIVDTVAPTITITSPKDGGYTNIPTVSISATASEPADVTVNGVGVTLNPNNAFSREWNLTEGGNLFTIRATDRAGNTATSVVTLYLDTVPPKVAAVGSIQITVGADGLATVTGASGSVEPGALVTVRNKRTGDVVTVTANADGSFTATVLGASGDVFEVIVRDQAGNESAVTEIGSGPKLPPDPASIAPPLDRFGLTPMYQATSFLFTGSNPIQEGVAPGTINELRIAILRGIVRDRNGAALPGVEITIKDHPEFGRTWSRTDGMFDLAVNGGGVLVVEYQSKGYLPVQRKIDAPWRDYAWLPDVVMLGLDTQVTTVDFSGHAPLQMARGGVVTDSDGARQATIIFPQGTLASMVLGDGATVPLTSAGVRATEYTVGENGKKSMPGSLPPTSGYTYAVELSMDEAISANAKEVKFDRPVALYVDNFLEFPVGGIVPSGWYDRAKAAWVPSQNGRVVKVLSVSNGLADLDVVGKGETATAGELGVLGINEAERIQLAQIYPVGKSIWRIQMDHFTAWDFNWPYGPPPDAKDPPPPDKPNPDEDCSDAQSGSIIECQNQVLGERIPIVGTPFSLNYRSDRVKGFEENSILRINVTGPTVPDSIKRIDLELSIAGKRINQQFSSLPNQVYTYRWDGRDAFGRLVKGAADATYTLKYVYQAVYYGPAAVEASFSQVGTGIQVGGNRLAAEINLSRGGKQTLLGDSAINGVGMWTLDPHHAYVSNNCTLYKGDGTRLSAEVSGTSVVETVAVTNVLSDDQPESYHPHALAVGPDGSFYTAGDLILKVQPDGTIVHLGGSYVPGFSGDGGPATQAQFSNGTVNDIAVASDGSVYIADTGNRRIRRIGSNGIVTTVAGNGTSVFSGDGGPATQAGLGWPMGIAVGNDGTLYIADSSHRRVRRVGPDGIITTVAGTGVSGFSGDGDLANKAKLTSPLSVALGADGSLYMVDSYRIRRITPDGIINTIAGVGTSGGFVGDGKSAIQTRLMIPSRVAVAPGGVVYILENAQVIRRIGLDGIITRVLGTGIFTASGAFWDNTPATQVSFSYYSATLSNRGLALSPDGALHVIQGTSVRRVAPSMPGVEIGNLAVVEAGERHVFDSSGRHLESTDTLTGTKKYVFGYGSQGELIAIKDSFGNSTLIERNAEGTPKAIVAPNGQRTELTLNANGYLESVTNPAGESFHMSYTPGGLLKEFTNPRDLTSTFAYTTLGRLVKDTNAAGGGWTLARSISSSGYEASLTSAEGRTTRYQVEGLTTGERKRTNLYPDGTVSTFLVGTGGQTSRTSTDGTFAVSETGPDPRFGMADPVPSLLKVTTPGGLVSEATTWRTATLADSHDLLSHTKLSETMTVNGRAFSSMYTASNRTQTLKTPTGRLLNYVMDEFGQVTSEQEATLATVHYIYDSRGRVSSVVVGEGADARTVVLEYDVLGNIKSVTDPLMRKTVFEYDLSGRVTKQTMPDERWVKYTYDKNGNVTSLTPPGRTAHVFEYTPVDLGESYQPPSLDGVETVTRYSYNRDKDVTKIERPDGKAIDFEYDAGGRLSKMTSSRGGISYGYHPATGQLSTVSVAEGEKLSYAWDGFLPLSETWAGTIAGTVSRTYDNNFWMKSLAVNGSGVIYAYDNDGLLAQAGSLTLSRDPQNGLLSGTTLGTVQTNRSYDSFGELKSETATVNGAPVMSTTYSRDKLGRITEKVETVAGVTSTYGYHYDLGGRLDQVKTNGVITAAYSYDQNGNRLSKSTPSATETGTYDAQDRMATYGGVSYEYTANGEWKSKTESGATTGYVYDELGNLTQVVLPGDVVIEYVIDGRNRRVGKKVNGKLVQGFLYQDQLKLVAELDGDGNVIARFVYGSKTHVPDYMEKGGKSYRIVSDHLGSPRVIVDTSTGQIVQKITYNEYGLVIADSNPGFQPFGFAGGIYDQHTQLVRFGVRDFDPRTGRWAAKDPIGFAGGDTNLYAYSLHDPVNFIDTDGEFVNLVTGAVGAAVGAAVAAATGQSILAGAVSGGLSGLFPGGGVLANALIGAAASAIGTATDPCAGGKDYLKNIAAGALGGVAGRQLGLANGLKAARSGAKNAVSRAFGVQSASGSIVSGGATAF